MENISLDFDFSTVFYSILLLLAEKNISRGKLNGVVLIILLVLSGVDT